MIQKAFALLLTTLLFSAVAMAQSPDTVFIRQDHEFDDTLVYATDTVIFESGMRKQILIGTTFLPSTHNQMMARSYGLYLQKVTKTECKGNAEDKRSPELIRSIKRTDSTMAIDIQIFDNCCYEFLCDMAVDSTGTLNLIHYGYGTYCACNCCFGLTYHFTIEKNPEYAHIRAAVINGSSKTLKHIKP